MIEKPRSARRSPRRRDAAGGAIARWGMDAAVFTRREVLGAMPAAERLAGLLNPLISWRCSRWSSAVLPRGVPGLPQVSYLAFVAVALWPWIIFSEALTAPWLRGRHGELIRKVAFPTPPGLFVGSPATRCTRWVRCGPARAAPRRRAIRLSDCRCDRLWSLPFPPSPGRFLRPCRPAAGRGARRPSSDARLLRLPDPLPVGSSGVARPWVEANPSVVLRALAGGIAARAGAGAGRAGPHWRALPCSWPGCGCSRGSLPT